MRWGGVSGTRAPRRAMAFAVACFSSCPCRAPGAVRWKTREAPEAPPGPWIVGDLAPRNPPGPCPGWGDGGAQSGVWRGRRKGRRWARTKRPPGPPRQRAGERWRWLRCGEGRACSAGTRGMRSPRVCVRACAGPAPPLPAGGRGQRRPRPEHGGSLRGGRVRATR